MSTTYSTRCPHCGVLLYQNSYEERKKFAPTLQSCPHCGKKMIYSQSYEWENLTNDEKKSVLVFGADRYIGTATELKKIIRNCALSFFLIYPLFMMFKHIKHLRQWNDFVFDENMIVDNSLIQESIERTQDTEYRKMLLKLGRDFYGTEFYNV